jgi:hypothetical protein
LIPPSDGSALAVLYDELEHTAAPASEVKGVTRRRLACQSSCDLFVAVEKPVNVRLLVARFGKETLPSPVDVPAFSGLELSSHSEIGDNAARLTITVRAPQPALNDIFCSFAQDVTEVTAAQPTEALAARAFFNRLHQWQRLLQKAGPEGLTNEQQLGLFGELWYLREAVLTALSPDQAVSAWTGPDAAAADYQFVGGVAAEVKTTQGKAPYLLSISSERQLDDAGWRGLFLVHVPVEIVRTTGETLPELVASVRTLVSIDAVADALFAEKLLAAGYADVHADRYTRRGYRTGELHCYRVIDGFPRIVTADLANGVGSVQYLLSVAACQTYEVSCSTIFSGEGPLA